MVLELHYNSIISKHLLKKINAKETHFFDTNQIKNIHLKLNNKLNYSFRNITKLFYNTMKNYEYKYKYNMLTVFLTIYLNLNGCNSRML